MLIKIVFSIALLVVLSVTAAFFWQLFGYKVAEPKYVVSKSDGPIEIRQYSEIIVAQVAVDGERYKAINSGFRVLAGYIFGDNQPKEKISMTAPVMQESTNIAMTSPVTQQLVAGNWVVRFVMPAKFTMATLPKPNNPKIHFVIVPSREYIVIRFAGFNTDQNLQKNHKLLLEYITKNKINTTGTPIMAFYNPPWTFPFLRRNEIMIELVK